MKYKTIEKIPPRMPGSGGRVFTTEYLSDGKTFVLDYWNNFVYKGRYAMNKETGEYASQHITHTWTNRGLLWFYRSDPSTSNYYVYMSTKEKKERITFEDLPGQQALRDFLEIDSNATPWCRTLYDNITRRENEYNVSRRATTSRNPFARVDAVMEKIPQRPSDLEEWIDKVAAGGADYLMAVKETGEYSCTACGKTSKPEQIIRANKKEMPKNRKKCKCPKCRSEVIMAKTGVKDIRTRFYCMQNVDETMSVSRHFQVHINYSIGDKKRIWLSEAVRFLMLRGFNSQRGGAYEIYYNQIPAYCYGQFYTGDNSWNTKKSWGNRFMGSGYLYPHGVTEALNGTEYEDWSRTFEAAGRLGIDMDYNLLMSSTTENMPNVCELLIKGRFYNMVREVACKVNVWNGAYYGPLEISGHSIEAVFGIGDKQLINRLREKDGGQLGLEWFRHADEYRLKLSDAFLTWALGSGISLEDATRALDVLTPEQLMNYIIRQRKEQYPGKTYTSVMNQYDDYLEMCEKLGKNLKDAMVYKPRELKRRHDELVEEINKQMMIEKMKRDKATMKQKAKEYRMRFPGAEENLKAIRDKFTWKDDEYMFIVPKSLLEIVTEGQALHHCVGATDRYFDRIVQRETFIVFLRKVSEPKIPYYTIEVEPGGTVRQHRGAFDEEPDIENIKPHIRKWQAHIRKNMTKKDRADALLSKKKREENIAQLKKDNNVRVLSGLLEDFMEAM